jgi:hypothetical protein
MEKVFLIYGFGPNFTEKTLLNIVKTAEAAYKYIAEMRAVSDEWSDYIFECWKVY